MFKSVSEARLALEVHAPLRWKVPGRSPSALLGQGSAMRTGWGCRLSCLRFKEPDGTTQPPKPSKPWNKSPRARSVFNPGSRTLTQQEVERRPVEGLGVLVQAGMRQLLEHD